MELIRIDKNHNQGLIIFDLDGTLLDSMQLHAEVFAQILNEQYGIGEEVSRSAYYHMSGRPLGLQFGHVIEGKGPVDTARVNDNVEDFYARIRQHDPLLFPDVLPALKKLWKAGYVLVVCSGNAPDIVERRLSQTGIKPFFTLWLGTDPAQGLRKGEAHFNILRQQLSLSLEQFQRNSLSVGDAQHDIQVAKNAGIVSVGRVNSWNAVSLQEACPDYLIGDFDELLQILGDPSGEEGKLIQIADLRGREDFKQDKK
jgi:phosphoglycolate phosphatase-like HAD superfamily hydrolase